jgi:hypothetical protein
VDVRPTTFRRRQHTAKTWRRFKRRARARTGVRRPKPKHHKRATETDAQAHVDVAPIDDDVPSATAHGEDVAEAPDDKRCDYVHGTSEVVVKPVSTFIPFSCLLSVTNSDRTAVWCTNRCQWLYFRVTAGPERPLNARSSATRGRSSSVRASRRYPSFRCESLHLTLDSYGHCYNPLSHAHVTQRSASRSFVTVLAISHLFVFRYRSRGRLVQRPLPCGQRRRRRRPRRLRRYLSPSLLVLFGR